MAIIIIKPFRIEGAKDFTLWFSEEGREKIRKEKYMKHFHWYGIAAALVVLAGFWFSFTQFKGMTWYEIASLFGIVGFGVCFVLEIIRRERAGKERATGLYKVKISYRDCRYSAYGPAFYTAATLLILRFILHICGVPIQ